MNRTLHDDLAHRLHHLNLAWAAFHGGPPGGRDVDMLAAEMVDSLHGQGPHDPGSLSALVLLYLVPEQEAKTSAFWGTELGRAMARWEKAPYDDSTEQVSPSVVAAILGVSRQRAGDLQREGRMTTPMAVAVALRQREAAA